MLAAARERFTEDTKVEVVEHNLNLPLPFLGYFDAVVSSFAIHHCADERKRSLYAEVFDLLESGGIFVSRALASPTPAMYQRFRKAIGHELKPEDPANKLLDVETQLRWLKEIGFIDVDCYWKWLELVLLLGFKPS